jgi:hypothetical protein
MKKKSVFLKLEEGLEIIVQGDYCPPEDESNFGGQLDVTKIDIVEGTLIDYTNYIENLMYQVPTLILTDHFSELALIKINQDV